MKIWIDADACPVVAKDLICKTAERTQTQAVFVANQPIKVRKSPLISMTVVPSGFDKADDYIAENVAEGDLVITSDIPLANDVLDNGGQVLTPHGIIYDANNIKQKLNARDFMDTMRSTGMLDLTQMGGQKPYSDKDKKAFADGLNKLVR
ncbi:YaiI/YqxD family protein [Psychrobacter sp. I-STPA6b]|uniref:YaiI/YqxD family protein n=1 Tax=Psychrobacter sp. I-STPA6b TaxID=2585718 RepID=UPI001D0C9295|nr:YaiI/YqxD family protein [Psychrobacter sp. I-STPA6b]